MLFNFGVYVVVNVHVNKSSFPSPTANTISHGICFVKPEYRKQSQRKSFPRKISRNERLLDKVTLFEEYVSLAHMATRQGDNALAETYYQRAEHALKSDEDAL